MKLARILWVSSAVQVVVLLAAACWMRLSSLEDMPGHLGDESFYANQAARLLDGRAVSIWTTSGNLLDPFFAVLEIPLLLLVQPSLWALRVPSAVCGLLAVVLTYALGRRILDRTTALLAAVFLAALPVAIVFSRIGCEFSQTPLFDLVALYFAFRADGRKTFAAFVACLIVHPTNIFLLPILLAVFLTQALRRAAGDRAGQRRLLLQTGALALAAVAALGAITFRRQASHQYYAQNFKSYDLLRFAISYGKLFFCQWPRDPDGLSAAATLRPFDWVYFTAVIGAFVVGSWRLARQRRWDRLALVAGLFASVAGLHVIAGSLVLREPTYRYGAFLIVPSVLALACVVQALLVSPTNPWRACVRQAQLAAVLAAVWPLLFIVQWYWFDYFTAGGTESLWTFRTDRPEPSKQLLSRILRDAKRPERASHARSGERWPVIVAQDWWTYPQMEYLARPYRNVRVVFASEDLLVQRPPAIRRLQEELWARAYVTGHANSAGERLVRSLLPPSCFQSCDVADPNGDRLLAAHWLNSAIPVPADYDGDGRADPAVFRSEDEGEWVVAARDGDNLERLGSTGLGIPAPGDYNGDGRADRAVYRPSGDCWTLDGSRLSAAALGAEEAPARVPAPADYDGDGRTDLATFRPDLAEWSITLTAGGSLVERFGAPCRCLPVPADYDGDGKADLAVFDLATNAFLIRRSSDAVGREATFGGSAELVPVPADYDGDGKADPAVYCMRSAQWSIRFSGGGEQTTVFGLAQRDLAVPADYDGDGRADLATFRPDTGQWHIRPSGQARDIARSMQPSRTRAAPRTAAKLDAASAGLR